MSTVHIRIVGTIYGDESTIWSKVPSAPGNLNVYQYSPEFGKIEPADDEYIEELYISMRSYNCLKRANILRVRNLREKTRKQLLALPGFGKSCLEDVLAALDSIGVKLQGE